MGEPFGLRPHLKEEISAFSCEMMAKHFGVDARPMFYCQCGAVLRAHHDGVTTDYKYCPICTHDAKRSGTP